MKRNGNKTAQTASPVFLTKVIISQHLLNLLRDGVSIKLRGHRNHFLDAETRMTRHGERSAKLRLPT